MANLINTSFFYAPISIAQITQPEVIAAVNRYINEGEPDVLEALLGQELFQSYQTDATTQRMKDLIEGKTYTNRTGQAARWRGLKETVKAPAGDPPTGGQYRSLIANYVYCIYLEDQETKTTGSGEKKLKAQNASDASAVRKVVKAWNQMVEWNLELIEFLLSNATTYPEFKMRYADNNFYRLIKSKNVFGI